MAAPRRGGRAAGSSRAGFGAVCCQRPGDRHVARTGATPEGIQLTTDRAQDPVAPELGPAAPEGPSPAPGVREELRRTKDAVLGLAKAHLALLKAELGEILDEVKVIAGLAGVIVAIALFAVQLVAIGGTLFLGEWIFGSIGWGVLHGLLLSIALIVLTAMAIVEAPRRVTAGSFVVAVILGALVSLALGANLARRGAISAADQLRTGSTINLDPTWAADLVGAVVGAIVLAIILLIVLGRLGGSGWAFGALVFGAILGAIVGWWAAGISFSWHGAVAVGLTFGLLAWIVLMPVWMLVADVDPTARFRRLYPKQSIDAANETKTWLEKEWAKRRAKLGRT